VAPYVVWEGAYSVEQLQAPGTGATTFFSVLDAASIWAKELELLVAAWDREEFTSWQPAAPYPFLLNVLVDIMFSEVGAR
jgi:hypothetical protein